MTKLAVLHCMSLLAILSSLPGARSAVRFVDTKRSFTCGSMAFAAETLSTPDRSSNSQVRSQAIRLRINARGAPRDLDLQQRLDPNPDLRNLSVVDAPAWAWGCVQDNNRKYYLLLLFTCQNSGAKQCSLKHEEGPVEWITIYNDHGKLLFPENRYVVPGQIHELRKLGIYENTKVQPDIAGTLFFGHSGKP